MTESFGINFDWLPNEYGNEAERVTLADLSINVGESCATKVEDIFAKTVRFSARLSALHLAEWFAANWWRLLWEPKANSYSWKASHKVGNAGRGYVWPDLAFSSDWQSVLVSSRSTRRWEAEPVQYLSEFDVPISISEFEGGVHNFIEGAIARLSSTNNAQSSLIGLWNEVVHERGAPDLYEWRSLEACMGFDPDEAPTDLLTTLLEKKNFYGASAIQEMAATSKGRAISHLIELWEAAKVADIYVRVPSFDNIRQQLDANPPPSGIPWVRATQAAQIAREVWGLDVPIQTGQLTDLFNITQGQFSSSPSNGQRSLNAGVRDDHAPDAFRISWSSNHPNSRRFALARLAADHIATREEERLLPGTNSATNRQKFQRAFAQEFLCPVDALKEHLGVAVPSNDDINDAAAYFDVSPLTVHNILVNKRIVDRESLEEWVA